MTKVRRIVKNIGTDKVAEVARFYADLFDLDTLMDMGWIATLGGGTGPVEISMASEGGSGAPVPDISMEVDDVDAVLAKALAIGATIVYGPADEPWGVRRFFLTDPAGTIVNVLSHGGADD